MKFVHDKKKESNRESNEITQIIYENGEKQYIYPLSSGQKGMWYLYKLSPNLTYYNVGFSISLQGDINLRILERSIYFLLEKHQILHTKILEFDQEVYQIIDNNISECIQNIDVKDLSELEDWKKKVCNRPFDLQHEYPIKFYILTISKNKVVLCILAHHICLDGWSIQLIFNEIKRNYNNIIKDDNWIFEPSEYQYFNFINTTSLNSENATNFWKNNLKDAYFYLDLPESYPRPKVIGGISKEGVRIFNNSSVLTICREWRISLFSFYFAIYFFTLFQITGQEDILVGTPVLNRNDERTHNVIGYFTNTLPFRFKKVEKESFRGMVLRLHYQILEMLEFDSVGITDIREIIETKTKEQELFSTIFTYQNSTLLPFQKDMDDKTKIVMGEIWNSDFIHYDLILNILEVGTSVNIGISYKSEIYSEDFGEKFLDQYIYNVKNVICPETETPNVVHHFKNDFCILQNRLELISNDIRCLLSTFKLEFYNGFFILGYQKQESELAQKAIRLLEKKYDNFVIQYEVDENEMDELIEILAWDNVKNIFKRLKHICRVLLSNSEIYDLRIQIVEILRSKKNVQIKLVYDAQCEVKFQTEQFENIEIKYSNLKLVDNTKYDVEKKKMFEAWKMVLERV